MRVSIVLLAAMFLSAWAVPNYANPQASDLNSTCASSPDQSFIQSPISIQNSPCGGYESFQISMNSINGSVPQQDAQRGSFVIPYNGTKFQINNNNYTSTVLTFRYQSEHVLPGGRNALEMQIEMENDVAGETPAVLSFMVQDIGDNSTDVTKMEQYRVYNRFKVIESLDPQGWVLNLDQLGQDLNNRQPNYLFLNIYTYPGTFTYDPCQKATWFVSGTQLMAPTSTINAFRDLLLTATQFTPGNTTSVNVNAMPVASAQSTQRLCFAVASDANPTGGFQVYLGVNYGLWFGICTILFFFILTLMTSEKPIKNPRYQEKVWTNHPIYSIRFFGNDMHTRKSRASIVLSMISLNAMFAAVFYNTSNNNMRSVNTILFGLYASLISWFVSFPLGILLRRFYEAKFVFMQTKDEAWEQRAQNRLFAFYTVIFFTTIPGWAITVWMMAGLNPQVDTGPSNLWVASFFIAIGLQMVVYFPIECILASCIGAFKNLVKRRAFMYDSLCHETYLAHLKQE